MDRDESGSLGRLARIIHGNLAFSHGARLVPYEILLPSGAVGMDDPDGDGRLTFLRVRERHPEGRLTPGGGRRLLLEQPRVSSVQPHGRIDW